MSTVALSGNDTIILDDFLLADLGDGDCGVLTFPNDISATKTGKNGNSIISLNEMGNVAELVLRIIRGSADDKRLNQRLAQMKLNFAGFPLMNGQVIKKVGDGQGNITNDTYVLSGGVFFKQVEAKTNVEGDTEQSLSIYSIRFAKAPRAIT